MSVYNILSDIQAYHGRGRAYGEKQLHRIPKTDSVDRVKFVLQRCKSKVVLDVGHASGELHSKITAVAKQVFGLDKERNGSAHSVTMDLDDFAIPALPFPRELGIELVVCGEVIEHLANPGWFLHRLGQALPDAELLITAPNAFSSGSRHWLSQHIENVNRDHVSWLSWHTLKVLVERYGYEVMEWHWYNGQPLTAEGLIFVCKLRDVMTW
jgi:2-polyprenyl-3-methyl-5-hydroxy-6-metoxy-1,4-benzoquinol methylase